MSQAPDNANSNGLPTWISSGVLGLVVGAGATVLLLHEGSPNKASATTANPAAAASGMAGMGGGAPPMGMGGGGGGGANGKRALTSLIGKLELLSRPTLTLHIDLDAEQAKAIAAKLEEFDKSEAMSADEAQANVDSLEALLTAEQKDALAAIGLPGGRGGRGGGGGGGGAPGAGGPPGGGGGGGGGMMMGMGGPPSNPNENPFTQEANHKRLHDLLVRIAPSSVVEDEKKE